MQLCIQSLSYWDDKRESNNLEIKAVLEKALVNKRTSRWEFHLEQSVKIGVISLFLTVIVLQTYSPTEYINSRVVLIVLLAYFRGF